MIVNENQKARFISFEESLEECQVSNLPGNSFGGELVYQKNTRVFFLALQCTKHGSSFCAKRCQALSHYYYRIVQPSCLQAQIDLQ
jgi:hypothetical protein